MNTKFYFPILALALSVAACNDKKAATQTGGIDVANLDRSVTPNQDFYQFACGGWMQAHPLTDEYGYRQAQWRRKYSYPAGIGKNKGCKNSEGNGDFGG